MNITHIYYHITNQTKKQEDFLKKKKSRMHCILLFDQQPVLGRLAAAID